MSSRVLNLITVERRPLLLKFRRWMLTIWHDFAIFYGILTIYKISVYRYRWRINSGLEHISRYCSYSSTQAHVFFLRTFLRFRMVQQSRHCPYLSPCRWDSYRNPIFHPVQPIFYLVQPWKGASVVMFLIEAEDEHVLSGPGFLDVMDICCSPSPVESVHLHDTNCYVLILFWVGVAVSVARWWWCSDHIIGSTTFHIRCTGWWQTIGYLKRRTHCCFDYFLLV